MKIKHNKKTANYRLLITFFVMFLIIIVLLIMNITSTIKYNHLKKSIIKTGKNTPSYSTEITNELVKASNDEGKKEVMNSIKSSFSEGSSTINFLRGNFPESIVFYNTDRYVFLDKDPSLPLNNFNLSQFEKDDKGFMNYKDPIIKTYKGIDVSKYQGNIDWSLVANDGIDFAFLRLGYRSYGTGIIKDDEAFLTNVSGALQNNLHVGVYFFTQAITKEEAVEEAQYVIEHLKPFKIDYPVVIDVEEIYNDTYRQQALSQEELTDIVIEFCETIKNAGYTPMIYGNLKGQVALLNSSRLGNYEKWYAEYASTPYYPYEMSIWQYSESGKINGISENVDLNISFKTW